MERLPHLPKSQASFRRPSPISPSSVRMLRQVLETRDTTRFINLSSTLRNIKNVPGEGSELSFQLSTLRKSVDKYSVSNFHKENRLRELKFKLKDLKESEIIKEQEIRRLDYYQKLNNQIEEALDKMQEELEDQRILENIQERMRATKKFLEKKEQKLKKELECHSHDLDTKAKQRKETVDTVNQFKSVFKEAFGQVEYEKDLIRGEISRLENQSTMKKQLIEKTEEHNKHRLEIVELTMIEERSAHLEEIRNSKLLHFSYDGFLRKKLAIEKVVFNRLNEAFARVKVKTGLQNVDEVIERFLTQEHNYRELTQSLHNKEIQCNDYKEKINSMQAKVDLLVHTKESSHSNQNSIKNTLDELCRMKEKQDEFGKVFLLVNIWIESMFKRMGFKAEELEKKTLMEKFQVFSVNVLKLFRNFLNLDRVSENEMKRKKVRIQEIMQVYLAMNVFRAQNREKHQGSEKNIRSSVKRSNVN